jgi:hypothetical protein
VLATGVSLQVAPCEEAFELAQAWPVESTATQLLALAQETPVSGSPLPPPPATVQPGLVGVPLARIRPLWSTATQNELVAQVTPVKSFVASIAVTFVQLLPALVL